jgi:hypothetical protein
MSVIPEQSNREHKRDWPKTLLTSVLLPIALTILTLFVLQPLAERYWQRPSLDVLGVQPIHFYEEDKNLPPEIKSPPKFYHHRLVLLFKVHNSSSTPTVIHTALIEGCVRLDNPLVAEPSLPQKEQIELHGRPIDFGYERHKHTVQSIRISGIFQDSSSSAIVVPSKATDYVGIFFPASTGPYYIVPDSASLSGECSNIKTPNKWVTINQLLEKASPRRFPKSLRQEFINGQLKISLLAANDQITVFPSQLKPLVSLPWSTWQDLLLPQMYENPQSDFPLSKKVQTPSP